MREQEEALTKIVKLPDASREEMLSAARMSTSQRWSGVDSGYGPDGEVKRDRPIDIPAEAVDALYGGGFSVVNPSAGSTLRGSVKGAQDAGMTVHRGVLKGDEYVNRDLLIQKTEEELGFTSEEVSSVYSRLGGPVPADQRQLRDGIDARMLALSRLGANMSLLAEILGVERRRIVAGIARARGKE